MLRSKGTRESNRLAPGAASSPAASFVASFLQIFGISRFEKKSVCIVNVRGGDS